MGKRKQRDGEASGKILTKWMKDVMVRLEKIENNQLCLIQLIMAQQDQCNKPHQELPRVEGGGIMYVVKADNPDVRYRITPPDRVTDSEGNPVKVADLVYSVESDNSDAVEVIPDPENELEGDVHFGAPNPDGEPALANINITISSEDGTLLGSFGAQFTVTPGDPKAIAGGGVAFDGLVES